MSATHHIPEAWPLLLTREQLCAYLGGLSWETVKKVLTVAPVDLGANVLRYRRPEIDAWVDTRPARGERVLPDGAAAGQGEANDAVAAVPTFGDDRKIASLDRVRARAEKGSGGWKKTA